MGAKYSLISENKSSTAENSNTSCPIKFGSVYGINCKIRPGYYFTTNKVMYKGEEIVPLPGEINFQKLKFGYLKSNKRVFYNGKPIPIANPVTFSVITRNNLSTLSKNCERNKEFIKLNAVLGMDFVGNVKRIYYRNNIIHFEGKE
jgi:hypothetical protein